MPLCGFHLLAAPAVPVPLMALFRADAKKRYSDLWERELCAGGVFIWPVSAPAEAWVRAGAALRGAGGSIAAFCACSTPAVRFYWDVLRLTHARSYGFYRRVSA